MLLLLSSFFTRLRNRHFLLIDAIVLCITPLLASLLRTDTILWGPALLVYVLGGLAIRLLVFASMGFYARYWRSASLGELGTLLAGNLVATLLLTGTFWGLRLPPAAICAPLPGFCTLPRSFPLLDSLLVLGAVCGLRLAVAAAARRRAVPPRVSSTPVQNTTAPQRVLIVGAGSAGARVADDLHAHPQLGMQPVGFADDDPEKQGLVIHGVPVLGFLADLPALLAAHSIQRVIVAMPSAPGKVVRAVRDTCTRALVTTCTIPSLPELLARGLTGADPSGVKALRAVAIEDLLRRAPVPVDTDAVGALLRGKRVLVTGAGGSIGSELCRQVLRLGPAELVILGHGENSVFSICQELQDSLQVMSAGIHDGASPAPPCPVIRTAIADVRFAGRLHTVFAEHRPQIVFHAAAHKHVPLMEEHPAEAVTNNVLGTANVLAAATAAGVERFVLISSDKAVRPTSVMGATKRVAELLVRRAAAETGRPYVAVRFGNVLGSRGSVVLTFQQQIARGGPVTVTDPQMRRFFMTIPEAVQLVLQAAALGEGGEVFMLEMGEPVKIVDLARDMIALSGLEEGRDIDIVYTGLRPGEKLFEELFVAGEEYTPTPHPRIFSTGRGIHAETSCPARGYPGAVGHRNAARLASRCTELDEGIAALAAAAERNDREAIIYDLRRLVGGYRPVTAKELS